MTRKPTIKQLEAFLMIEATRNFRQAAQRLNVSQPALSRTLALLEQAINARVLYRDTRTVGLSAAGKELLPIARRMVGEFNDAFSDLGSFVSGHSGRIVIASLPAASVELLPNAIEKYGIGHPHVEFEVLGLPELEVLEAVRDGMADFGITSPPTPAEWFTFTPLKIDEFMLLCRRDSPLAKPEGVDWSVFATHQYVQLRRSSAVRHMVDAIFAQLGITAPVRYQCDSISLAGALVAAGLGITASPSIAAHLISDPCLTLIPLRNPVAQRSIGLIIRNKNSMAPAANSFVELLKNNASALGCDETSTDVRVSFI